jgi:hypothetical protein
MATKALLAFMRSPDFLPPEGDVFQYRIKNANEPHERWVKEHELEGMEWPAALPLFSGAEVCPSTTTHQPNCAKGSRAKYRRFETSAEAIRFAVEELPAIRTLGAWMQVGDERFNSDEIQRFYESSDYPLRKPEWPSVLVLVCARRNAAAPSFVSRRMSERAEACRKKATECQRAALAASDPNIRQMYFDLAKQWKELTEQALAIERIQRWLFPMPPPNDK